MEVTELVEVEVIIKQTLLYISLSLMNFLDNDCIHVPMCMQTSHNLQLPHPLELSVRMNLIFLKCVRVIVYMYKIWKFLVLF